MITNVIIHTFFSSILEKAIDVQFSDTFMFTGAYEAKWMVKLLLSWNRKSDKHRLIIRVCTETASIWALEETFWIGGTTGAGRFVSLATLVKTKEDGIQRVLVIEVTKYTCVISEKRKKEEG